MTTDDRISRHLADQAGTLSLSPADPADIKRRGARRRHRRRGALVGTAAALAVLATSVAVVDRGDPDESVVLGNGELAVTPSAFDWTLVQPETGLGYGRSIVQTADGAVYGLSTAPGADGTDDGDFAPALYRSGDGAEWEPVALPDGVNVSSLGSSGDTLYAIGTAPAANGGRTLVVAAGDGGGDWSQTELPGELADLEARFPGRQISISEPTVAARDDDEVVATVVVTANPDVPALLPEGVDSTNWETTPEGVVVYELVPCENEAEDCFGVDPRGVEAEERRAAAAELEAERPSGPSTSLVDPDGEVTTDTVRQAGWLEGGEQPMRLQESTRYTWDELGLDPELQELVGGRTFVYSSHDGGPFERSAVPSELSGYGSQLIRVDDGYRLFLGSHAEGSSTTQVLRSSDGRTWADGGTVPGSPMSAGAIGGRAAVALFTDDGSSVVRVEQAGGTWSNLDLASAVDTGDTPVGVGEVAFGPLGMLAWAWTDNGSPNGSLVHTTDGTNVSVIDVSDHLDGGALLGLAVTADAFVARIGDGPDGDRSTPPTQRVLVGTPTG